MPLIAQDAPPKLKTDINILWLAIPAFCDFVGCTLMYIALTQCAASVYQMMRGIIVVITASMSILVNGRKQYAHHWFSLFTIVAGVALVGFLGLMYKTEGESLTSSTGIFLLLASQCFIGGQYITEEKILQGYYLDPFFLVGMEGFWGTVFSLICLPIYQKVGLEDTPQAFRYLRENPQLIIEACGIIMSIGAFNVCGIAVTKYASAAQRSTIDTARTLFIWVCSLILGWETFIWGQFGGFIILTIGTLIYNEIIVLPCKICN